MRSKVSLKKNNNIKTAEKDRAYRKDLSQVLFSKFWNVRITKTQTGKIFFKKIKKGGIWGGKISRTLFPILKYTVESVCNKKR